MQKKSRKKMPHSDEVVSQSARAENLKFCRIKNLERGGVAPIVKAKAILVRTGPLTPISMVVSNFAPKLDIPCASPALAPRLRRSDLRATC
jgi:hypothetical protein